MKPNLKLKKKISFFWGGGRWGGGRWGGGARVSRLGGGGARVSDFFYTKNPNLKKKFFFFFGGGGGGGGGAVGERGEGARVSDFFFFTMNPYLK